MDKSDTVRGYANELEGVLRNYLNCHYTEFGVKANGNLDSSDWKSPVNFALGYKYAESNNDPAIKQEIDYFLGNDFYGENMGDIVGRYNYYNFNSENDACNYIKRTIDNIKRILSL